MIVLYSPWAAFSRVFQHRVRKHGLTIVAMWLCAAMIALLCVLCSWFGILGFWMMPVTLGFACTVWCAYMAVLGVLPFLYTACKMQGEDD